jgi:prepilin-type N-terminal cleavage/methylation domain-containing protein
VTDHHHDTDGFTLVEVLVAFVIMSLAVITGMSVFGDGVRRLAIVEERLGAVAAARAALDLTAAGQAQAGVSQQALPGTDVEWSALQPHVLNATVNGQKLETVVLLPVPR